jgi:hypothetical protein
MEPIVGGGHTLFIHWHQVAGGIGPLAYVVPWALSLIGIIGGGTLMVKAFPLMQHRHGGIKQFTTGLALLAVGLFVRHAVVSALATIGT